MNKDEFDLFKSNEDDLSIENTKPTILIIDDDSNVGEALIIALKRRYDLILCTNGNEGIEKINPDVYVVVLDIKMEGLNGFETFIEIKKKNPFVPIIFHSAYQDLKSPYEIMNDYRPFGYVIKEGDVMELRHTIESAIEYYHQINQNKKLVKQLHNENKKLQELQENLENMVGARTSELTKTNKELHKEIETRQKAENKIKSLLEEKEIILKEVHHRIKNNMATLIAILNLHAETLNEPTAITALKDTENRVQSMLVLYEKLYQSPNFEEMSVNQYLPILIDQITRNFPNYRLIKIEKKIGDFVLDTKRLQSLGIIINELITNIMKYAFTGRNDGLIIIDVSLKSAPDKKENIVSIVIQDNGNGFPESIDFKNSTSFGLILIEMLTKQLNGDIQIERKNGTKITLEFEL